MKHTDWLSMMMSSLFVFMWICTGTEKHAFLRHQVVATHKIRENIDICVSVLSFHRESEGHEEALHLHTTWERGMGA
jgi:hypothetical protein